MPDTRARIPVDERCGACDGHRFFILPADLPEETCWVCIDTPGRRTP